ncbi:hypothetical protein PFNF54_00351 [Plasmodium falciparum NF54]|uniref:Plasmodium RESA N-terminal domain-containing protein n=1 Tax=Plasmodium falciparum (isolate NF54) TaxID=5843 RepID=W7KCJ5_PLAFO|nr:hypothetical protein PFNF54_00351 [Plasmodium falciparum NF54]
MDFSKIFFVIFFYDFISIIIYDKNGKSIDEMKNCIYAFIKYYDTLQNDLFNEHKTIFTQRIKNTQRLDM